MEQNHCLTHQNNYHAHCINRYLNKKNMKMPDSEANSPEFVLELENDDKVLFDDVNDYGYGLQAKNPDSVRESCRDKKWKPKTGISILSPSLDF